MTFRGVRRYPADARPQSFELPGILADTQDAEQERIDSKSPGAGERFITAARKMNLGALPCGG